mgnify:CR=1 FL=1
MKKCILTLGLFALTFMGTSCTKEVQKDNTLKVLSWNIWHEGHSNKYGKQACDGVIGVLKKSEADVILMIETYGTSDKVADSLGYYHRLLSSNLSIYSRYPIVKTYTFPDQISTFNFGAVERKCAFSTPGYIIFPMHDVSQPKKVRLKYWPGMMPAPEMTRSVQLSVS